MRVSSKPPDDLPTSGTAAQLVVREHADLLSGGGRAHTDITVPRTEIRGRMRLLSRSEVHDVKRGARKFFSDMGMPCEPNALAAAGFMEEWNLEVVARLLALAVRDPKDESLQLATIDDWRDCDDDQLNQLFARYKDYQEELDPLGPASKLSTAECAEIVDLAKKKQTELLVQFGSWKLALFATTSVSPPTT